LPAEALSPGEKSVLHGLARFPSYNDRLLARELGATPSTLTAVRARLEERGLFRRIYIPSLPAMRAHVLSTSSGGLSPEGLVRLKRALGRGLFPAGGCDSFLAVAGPSGWLELGAFPDYSRAQCRGDGLARLLGRLPAGAGETGARSLLPVELVRFHNFFDFAPLLGRFFGLRGAPEGPRPFPPAPARRLSPVEKLVLYGLVKRPGAADRETAGELGVSRQAVARARRVLAAEGRLLPAVVPDLGRLGFGMLALCRFRLPAEGGRKRGRSAVEALLGSMPHLFAASAGPELLVLGAWRDTAMFEREAAALRQGPAWPVGPAPVVHTLSLEGSVAVRDHDYVPFVKAAMGLEIAD
jgi:transposase-like protein